jgi:hypothetical protein
MKVLAVIFQQNINMPVDIQVKYMKDQKHDIFVYTLDPSPVNEQYLTVPQGLKNPFKDYIKPSLVNYLLENEYEWVTYLLDGEFPEGRDILTSYYDSLVELENTENITFDKLRYVYTNNDPAKGVYTERVKHYAYKNSSVCAWNGVFANTNSNTITFNMRCYDAISVDEYLTYSENIGKCDWNYLYVRPSDLNIDNGSELVVDKTFDWEKPIDVISFEKAISENRHHFDAINDIIKKSGVVPEGNCFQYHQSFREDNKFRMKQYNLMEIGRKCDKILEIGFNAGHSSMLMLMMNPKCTIQAFDICYHPYVIPCLDYINRHFGNRIELIVGNSHSTITRFKANHPEYKYDAIHIDGLHEYTHANFDYFMTRSMGKLGSIVIFDDTQLSPMKYLWKGYIRDKHMLEIDLLPPHDESHKIGTMIMEFER